MGDALHADGTFKEDDVINPIARQLKADLFELADHPEFELFNMAWSPRAVRALFYDEEVHDLFLSCDPRVVRAQYVARAWAPASGSSCCPRPL